MKHTNKEDAIKNNFIIIDVRLNKYLCYFDLYI